MSDDVLEQIGTHVKEYPFYSIGTLVKEYPFYSILFHFIHFEFTDIAGLPELSAFIWYINNAAVSEDLLFCKALKLHTKGEDIFPCLNDFFINYFISWKECAGISTDGAAACTGFKSGVVKPIKDKAPNAEWTHCFFPQRGSCRKKEYRKNCTKY